MKNNLRKLMHFFNKSLNHHTHTKEYDDFFLPYFIQQNNTLKIEEPKTIANYVLENSNDQLYNEHKFRLSNQWINPIQGINSGLGTANLSIFNYQVVNYTECGYLAQDPLMNNIFDILTTTPLSKEGTLKILDDSGNEIENTNITNLIINKVSKKFKVKETLEKAIKSSYIYGGCLLYLDYGDINYLDTPINLKTIDKTKFRGFRHIDPILCSAVDVNTWNVGREDYMEPTKWFVTGLGTVHKSRFIKFEWNTPPIILKPLCMYFGMPMTQLLKQDIANTNLVSQGLANLVNKIRRTYIKMDKQTFASGNVQSVMNRLRLMQEVENNFTIFPIDYSEDIVQLTTSLSGIQDTVETFFDILSNKTGIPRNKLKGSSTGGLNSHTNQIESDKNFTDKIETIRSNLIKDRLIKMFQVAAGTIDNKLYNFDYEFEPIYTLSEKETAETIEKNLDISLKMQQLGINPKDCVDWLKNNETNNMSTISSAIKPQEKDYENNQ